MSALSRSLTKGTEKRCEVCKDLLQKLNRSRLTSRLLANDGRETNPLRKTLSTDAKLNKLLCKRRSDITIPGQNMAEGLPNMSDP